MRKPAFKGCPIQKVKKKKTNKKIGAENLFNNTPITLFSQLIVCQRSRNTPVKEQRQHGKLVVHQI